jgi:pilus assembly protein CpaB
LNRKALVAALVVAAVGVALLLVYKRRFEAAVSGGAPVAVLMARQDIPLGAVLTEAMLATRDIPESYVEKDRHVLAEDRTRVLGVRLRLDIKANETIQWSDLATTSGERRDLSSLVKPNMRAITVRADSTTTFGGLLRPGDRVDVSLTISVEDRSGAALGTSRQTLALLQNVLVLAVGQDTGASEDTGGRRPTQIGQVTLSVPAAQAQLVTFAGDRGRLSLALRNPEDIAVLENVPETTIKDIVDAERRAQSERKIDAP